MERKRSFAHNSPNCKRVRCQSSQELSETYRRIDSVPLRSSPSSHLASRISLPIEDESARPLLFDIHSSSRHDSSFSSTSVSSTKISFFSSPNTSFATSENTSFSIDDVTEVGDVGAADDGQSTYYSCPESRTDSDEDFGLGSESLEGTFTIPLHLEKRLRHVFPTFANGSFNNAPLAVIWEFTRQALHCGIDLEKVNIQYNSNIDLWRSHLSISRHAIFDGKALKTTTNDSAWVAALTSFQCSNKAVVLSGTLFPNVHGDGPLFNLELDPLRLESSNRLFRRFGSDRFLQLSMPSPADMKRIIKCTEVDAKKYLMCWLKRIHYFIGRQWSVFFNKEDKTKNRKRKRKRKKDSKVGKTKVEATDITDIAWFKVYFFACDGDSFRKSPDGSLPPHQDAAALDRRVKIDLPKMMKWTVGDLQTSSQQAVKHYSRIALSLTDTTPTVVLEKCQIYHCPVDIGGKVVMNDGIGQLSESLATKIAHQLGLTYVPSAFQARFGSAKGVWIVTKSPPLPTVDSNDWIVTYPSQRKWDCDQEDPAHRTFEVNNYSGEVRSATLNLQFIPLLEAQAEDPCLMRETLVKYLRETLDDDLGSLKNALDSPVLLLDWLRRMHRPLATESFQEQGHLAGFRCCEDMIAGLICSGFSPKNSFLKNKFRDLGFQQADTLLEKGNIDVPCSAWMMMVADFSGTLAEDEVHVSFSTKFEAGGFSDTLLENMDVLIARVPAHLPTDIQRVKVVSRPELRHLKDVIVFPIKGKRPLADKLSGGDYDGDKAWVCWDQALVQNFRNATFPAKNDDLVALGLVRKLDLPMSRLRNKYGGDAEEFYREFIHRGISFSLEPCLLGICTNYKEDYCRITGLVTSATIIRLGNLLSWLVDQLKQGVLFNGVDWSKFLNHWNLRPNLRSGPSGELLRKKGYILDFLQDVMKHFVNKSKKELSDALEALGSHTYDKDLTSMFTKLDEKYASKPDWTKLTKHLEREIERVRQKWSSSDFDNLDDTYPETVSAFHAQWQQIQPPAELASSEFLQDGTENMHFNTWELLKASFAFKRLHNRGTFVWYMATTQLGCLKALASGERCVMLKPEVYAAMRPDKKYVARERARRLGETGIAEWGESQDGDDVNDD